MRYVKDDTGWIQQSNEYASSRERLSSWSYASVDITYYTWGGSSVLAEYTTQSSSSSLTWQKSYIYAGSRLLSTITNTAGSEVTEYHHPDRLGTRLITNPVGATQVEQNTLPFGTSIDAETSGTSNQRFTSYDRSDSTGLDYAVNRTYSSGQSRFTQVDPIGMAAASITDPQSMNLYAYVQNNPIDFVDPSGLLMAMPDIGTFTVDVSIWWWDDAWDNYWGADNGWTSGGDTGRRTPPDPEDEPIGGEPPEEQGSPSPLSNRRKDPPCPVSGKDIASDPHFKFVWDLALVASKLIHPGRWVEAGGWILAKKGVNEFKYAILLNPENTATRTYGLGEPKKYIPDLLNDGWHVIADFHTQAASGSIGTTPSGGDLNRSTERKVPGIAIGLDGQAESYGVDRGVFGIGIPKGCKRKKLWDE